MAIKLPIFGTGKNCAAAVSLKLASKSPNLDSGFCNKKIKGLKPRGVDPITYPPAV